MSALRTNNLVKPVSTLNVSKDSNYVAETTAHAHYDFSTRSFKSVVGDKNLVPKTANFLFKDGELRQKAGNDFSIESDVNDNQDLTYSLVFKVYSNAPFSGHIGLFGNSLYGIEDKLGGSFLAIQNSTGINQLAIRTLSYQPNLTFTDLEVGVAYFAIVEREFSTKKFAVKVYRLSDDALVYTLNPTVYNSIPTPPEYRFGIGRMDYVSVSVVQDFGISELVIWKSLQYANAAEIYKRAKSRNLIKGYI